MKTYIYTYKYIYEWQRETQRKDILHTVSDVHKNTYNQTFIALNLVNRLQAAIIISITNTVCSQGGSITKATAQ